MKLMMKFCLCFHKITELWNLFSLVPVGNYFSVLFQAIIYVFSFKKKCKMTVKYLKLLWYRFLSTKTWNCSIFYRKFVLNSINQNHEWILISVVIWLNRFPLRHLDIRPPSITCPNAISVPTDAGKPTAKICIPKASASDNSGQPPTITNDAGAQSKEFAVSSVAHEVKYTATDAAGLTSTCTLQITVSGKGLSRAELYN